MKITYRSEDAVPSDGTYSARISDGGQKVEILGWITLDLKAGEPQPQPDPQPTPDPDPQPTPDPDPQPTPDPDPQPTPDPDPQPTPDPDPTDTLVGKRVTIIGA